MWCSGIGEAREAEADARAEWVREAFWGDFSKSEESNIGLGRRGRAGVEDGRGAEPLSAACSQGSRRTIVPMKIL